MPTAEAASPRSRPGARYVKVTVHEPAGRRTPWISPTARIGSGRDAPPAVGVAVACHPGRFDSLRTSSAGVDVVTRSTSVPLSAIPTWVAVAPAGPFSSQTGGRTDARWKRAFPAHVPVKAHPGWPRASWTLPSKA